MRKPNGYWANFANLKRELRDFIAVQDLPPGQLPAKAMFLSQQRSDLWNAIQRHGGVSAVARQLGLEQASGVKPPGYWQEFANVEAELRAFIEAHGQDGVMPEQRAFARHGCSSLGHAIDLHGGLRAVAARLNLRPSGSAAPRDHWADFANVERELRDFVSARGTPGVMPTYTQLEKAHRYDLLNAIRRHGSWAQVAARLDLARPGTDQSTSYWRNFANVESELRDFCVEHGIADGQMPTYTELERAGRRDVIHGLEHFGGIRVVTERLGWTPGSTARPPGFWSKFATVKRELRDFCAERGIPRRQMPTRDRLEQAGRHDLLNGVNHFGGLVAVAERLGWQGTPHQPGYWTEFGNLEAELRAFVAEQDTPGVMPSTPTFLKGGHADLLAAIAQHGGLHVVAERLGWTLDSGIKPPGYWRDFENLECELREFAARLELDGQMPSRDQFEQAGRLDLAQAIRQHGGQTAVARRLDWRPNRYLVPYRWKDFGVLRRALNNFIDEQKLPSERLPSYQQLRNAGHSDLVHAIYRYGGFQAVAERLGWERQVHAAGRRADRPER